MFEANIPRWWTAPSELADQVALPALEPVGKAVYN